VVCIGKEKFAIDDRNGQSRDCEVVVVDLESGASILGVTARDLNEAHMHHVPDAGDVLTYYGEDQRGLKDWLITRRVDNGDTHCKHQVRRRRDLPNLLWKQHQ
jgi:hypothetical protein